MSEDRDYSKGICFVVGLLINPYPADGPEVLLVTKQRPDWQRGKLNGVGGKIEAGETPYEAMAREFSEETGTTLKFQWNLFCRYRHGKNTVYFFESQLSKEDWMTVWKTLCVDESREFEKVDWYPVRDLPANVIHNLTWMVPLALDRNVETIDAVDKSAPWV